MDNTVRHATHLNTGEAEVSWYLGQRSKVFKGYKLYARSYGTWWAKLVQRM